MTGAWVLLAALVITAAVGLAVKARHGRVRRARGTIRLPGEVRSLVANSGLTLLQISTTFCAPCRHVRAQLTELAKRTEGVRHRELDVTERPDLARSLRVLSTPTTLVLDAGGAELFRFSGMAGADVIAQVTDHVA